MTKEKAEDRFAKFSLDGEVAFAGKGKAKDTSLMRGLIWKPVEGFHDTWVDDLVGNFKEPVDFNTEHWYSIFDGKLGQLSKVWIGTDKEGKRAVMGEWEEPAWLGEALKDDPRKVSVELDLWSKRLVGIALVRHPRVEDAALEKAFSLFSEKRRRTAENGGQEIIDGSQGSANNDSQESKEKPKMSKSLWSKVWGALSTEEKAELATELGAEQTPLAALPMQFSSAQSAELARLQKFESDQKAEETRRIQNSAAEAARRANEEADDWIRGMVKNGVLNPSEVDQMRAAYSYFATDPRRGTDSGAIKFSSVANKVETSQSIAPLSLFKALVESRAPHKMTEEQAPLFAMFNQTGEGGGSNNGDDNELPDNFLDGLVDNALGGSKRAK